MSQPDSYTLERDALDELFGALARRGYTVVGPTVRDQAIVYEEIGSSAELPIGWTDEQDGGHYRLRRRDDEALFGYNVGPNSWKSFQLPPEVRLWRARRDDRGGLTELDEAPREAPRYAFLGARSCELHATGILDRVLLGGAHTDPADRARRGGGRIRRRVPRRRRAHRQTRLLSVPGRTRRNRHERATGVCVPNVRKSLIDVRGFYGRAPSGVARRV
jgi:hypothetical protein